MVVAPRDAYLVSLEKEKPFLDLVKRLKEQGHYASEGRREVYGSRVVKFKFVKDRGLHEYSLLYTDTGKLRTISYRLLEAATIIQPDMESFEEQFRTGQLERECWETLRGATEGIELFTI